jgi:hypothetical protein
VIKTLLDNPQSHTKSRETGTLFGVASCRFVDRDACPLLLSGASREARLLVACARSVIGSDDAARIRALAEAGVDWPRLCDMAIASGVGPLLYGSLRAACPGAVPAAILERLRERFRANAQRNLHHTAELLRLLGVFESHGIAAIPLKGPALAARAYGNLSLREFIDLDILVRRPDLARAAALLEAEGYTRAEQLGSGQEQAYIQAQHHYSFVRDDMLIELHFELRERFFGYLLDIDALWSRAETTALAGRQVLGFCPEDVLVTLCMHGTGHCWERLSWICDIAELVRVYPALEWQAILRRARELGSARMVGLGLFLAHALLGAALPAAALRAITSDPAIERLARQVAGALFRARESPRGLLETSLFYLGARERLRDRARYCLRLAATPTLGDWRLIALPAQLSFLYYLLRPLRLLWAYGWGRLQRPA